MGSGKQGGKNETYNYYGTLAGAIRAGEIDAVMAVIVDGVAIFDGPALTFDEAEYVDIPGVDPLWFPKAGGYVRVYRGSMTQTADPALPGHPAYRGVAYMVARNLLFGKERSTAPNIEVIARAKVAVSTDIIPAEHNTVQDGQVNVVAVLAEICTSRDWLGMPAGKLDTASWQSVSAWANASADRRAALWCSPIFTDQLDARSAIGELLSLMDGALRWTAQGTLAIMPMERGENPGDLPIFDARHFTDLPRLVAESIHSVPTGVVVVYTDRDRKYKEAAEKVDHLAVRQLRGEDDRQRLDRPHITRHNQAARQGAEFIRLRSAPAAELIGEIRSPLASTLQPGDKCLFDVDPEPTGEGLAQLGIVREIREPTTGPVKIVVDLDPLVSAIPYSPAWTAEEPQDAEVPAIAYALIVPLPPTAWPFPPALAVLATRPRIDVVGARVLFRAGDSGEFGELGRQPGFAARAIIGEGITNLDTTVRLVLLDGADGPDAYLASATPGGNQVEARADMLFCVLANVVPDTLLVSGAGTTGFNGTWTVNDPGASVPTYSKVGDYTIAWNGSEWEMLDDQNDEFYAAPTLFGPWTAVGGGQTPLPAVVADPVARVGADGWPEMEILSIVSREAITADTHDYEVIRGRRGLPARAWSAAITQAWILPAANLIPWRHPDMAGMLLSGDAGAVILRSYSDIAEDESDPPPQFPLLLPPGYAQTPHISWSSPAGALGVADPDTGAIDIEFDVTDPTGDLVSVRVDTLRSDGSNPTTVENQTFPPVASKSFDTTLIIDPGTYTLTVTATDKTGNIVQSTRTLWRADTGGGGGAALQPPTFHPPGDTTFAGQLDVHISIAAGNRIEYTTRAIGAPAPTSGTVVIDTSVEVTINSNRTVWARGGNGTDWTQWVAASYELLDGYIFR
jgi:hypothetical protein